MSQNLFLLTVSAHCLSIKHCDFNFYVYSFIKNLNVYKTILQYFPTNSWHLKIMKPIIQFVLKMMV